MAEGDGHVYAGFLTSMARKRITLAGSVLHMGLLTGHTPQYVTHKTWADSKAVGAEESGTGYTARGAAVAGVTLTLTANGTWKLDATDVSWATLTVGQPSHSVLFAKTSGRLIASWEIATTSNGGTYTLVFAGTGVATIGRA